MKTIKKNEKKGHNINEKFSSRKIPKNNGSIQTGKSKEERRQTYFPPQLASFNFMMKKDTIGTWPGEYLKPPGLENWQKEIAQKIRPDIIWIESVVCGDSLPFDFSIKEDAVRFGAFSIPGMPLKINYRIWKGLSKYTEAILIARVTDGVISPRYLNISLPLNLEEISGVFEIGEWGNPFPPALFGYHKLIVELWELDPNGQPLPQEYQNDLHDSRNYTLESSDSGWFTVYPGCLGSGGISWSTLKTFSVSPLTVALNSNGTRIATNQVVTVKWQVDHAGLLPTQYGFKGSFQGIRLYLPDNSFVDSSLENGQLSIDLSGMPYQNGIGITIQGKDTSGCGFQQKSIGITGIMPNTQPPAPSPADIMFIDSWSIPGFPNQGEEFTVYFSLKNIGGKSTGPFNVRVELDNGIEISDVEVQNLDPSEDILVYWNFQNGLLGRQHFLYCYLDSNNSVIEIRKDNNIGYRGIILN